MLGIIHRSRTHHPHFNVRVAKPPDFFGKLDRFDIFFRQLSEHFLDVSRRRVKFPQDHSRDHKSEPSGLHLAKERLARHPKFRVKTAAEHGRISVDAQAPHRPYSNAKNRPA